MNTPKEKIYAVVRYAYCKDRKKFVRSIANSMFCNRKDARDAMKELKRDNPSDDIFICRMTFDASIR